MKHQRLIRIAGFILLSIAFQILLFELYGRYKTPEIEFQFKEGSEWFDPSLMRLNSMDKLESYCDSVFGKPIISTADSAKYANLVGFVLRYRFYHGYSYYKLGQNFIGWALAPFVHKNMSAIVIPNDILKHPNAACSQQSIIGMELFRKKGFTVRKVGFFDPIVIKGHFCFEVFYGNKWHFFDPDKEPVLRLLVDLNRPSIKELTSNKKLMDSIYYKEDSIARSGYLTKFSYGPVNKFPAPNAIIYQYVTMFLSWTLFFWLILFGWWVWRRVKVS